MTILFSILFAKISLKTILCEEGIKIVSKYGKASSQSINFDKFSLIFGKRIDLVVRQQIKDSFEIQNEGGMGIYLKISEDIGGSKCKLFAFMNDKINAQSEWMNG